ncbi:hypothetical protein ACOMHN_043590 [Nucella lapillus]
MVRTKADCSSAAGRKVVAARAPRKSLGASSSGAGSSSSAAGGSPAGNKYAGGNTVCSRPTPDWQKGIGSFFTKAPDKENLEPQGEPGCSGSEPSGSQNSQPGGSGSQASSSSPCSSKTKARRPVIRDDSDEEDDS